MRIAFDLDNTLICCGYNFPLEPKRSVWARLLGGEPLRRGIVELHDFCRAQGWEVWVYTTSYRRPWYIRKLFWFYGLRLDGVVNQARHQREAKARCTKHPPSFGIDWLVDDAPGVGIEAERHNFRAVIISPEADDWVRQVKAALLRP
ncbi:hypothetical protein [Hymenobacter cellulosilyticus]|uniref:Uncharacterized protein n=1 Tax=Hymenobacter cellulosilyticus TaxID=2932248 RepID=A0A8T9Q3P6_9BACT|nr:hypothetical protein [Hymenobacter cellulosilyticus]UOQ72097.1 hypothetical protein MUN79_26605 [Hymenobacter cellulosilyticus]